MPKHTPGPWRACNNGECRCGFVWSQTADCPVAKVERGKWGDDYADIEGGKAVMRQITYGEIPVEIASANARLVAAAPEMLEALESTINDVSEIINMVKQDASFDDIETEGIRVIDRHSDLIRKAKGE